jgi:hypothetical protein
VGAGGGNASGDDAGVPGLYLGDGGGAWPIDAGFDESTPAEPTELDAAADRTAPSDGSMDAAESSSDAEDAKCEQGDVVEPTEGGE